MITTTLDPVVWDNLTKVYAPPAWWKRINRQRLEHAYIAHLKRLAELDEEQ